MSRKRAIVLPTNGMGITLKSGVHGIVIDASMRVNGTSYLEVSTDPDADGVRSLMILTLDHIE